MNNLLDREQKRWVKKIIEFADKNLNSYPDTFTYEVWNKCAKFGMLAMCIPEQNGGFADSQQSSLIMHYALGYGCTNNGLIFAINNHLIVAEGIFPKFANRQQYAKYRDSLSDGSIIASYAITEADHGSDSLGITTTVRKVNEKYVLDGSKMYISNCTIADLFIVIAKCYDSDKKVNSLSAFLVHKDDVGVEISTEIKKMGLEGCPMGELNLKKCILPLDRLLGNWGEGLLVANVAMEWERTFIFASHLGTMERIMEECIKYVNSRKQFNKTIGSYQLTSSKIVKMGIAIKLGMLLLLKIGKLRDDRKNTYYESAMFKYYIGEKYVQTCLDALQLFGAYGYSVESGIEKQLRDSIAAKIYSGTSEIQLDIMARLMGIKVDI